jgi:hypothetical protein
LVPVIVAVRGDGTREPTNPGGDLMTEDTQAVVAAILAAVRIMQQGIPGAASTRGAYEAEYRKMLDRVQNPHSPEPPERP